MIAIHLHGAAGQMFGRRFDLDIKTPSEALRALSRLLAKKNFTEFLRQGEWRVIKGPTKSAIREGRDLEADHLDMLFGQKRELHLIPVAAGSKKAGIGKIIAGVVIIAASIVTAGAVGAFATVGMAATFGSATAATAGTFAITYANVAMFGASLLLGGISQMLAGNPKAQHVNSREDSTQRVSGLFNGPVNVSEEGQALPLVYSGPDGVIVGSVVLSSGMTTEQRAA
ncbi:hypothetical protein [Dongia sp.]|uniref:hypothetical protein n=1 Tax=Dongia sp. TaxID=1977262 RepID=UPI0035AF1BE2